MSILLPCPTPVTEAGRRDRAWHRDLAGNGWSNTEGVVKLPSWPVFMAYVFMA